MPIGGAVDGVTKRRLIPEYSYMPAERIDFQGWCVKV